MDQNSSKQWVLFSRCENNIFRPTRGHSVYVNTYSCYTLVTLESASRFGHFTPRTHQTVRQVVPRPSLDAVAKINISSLAENRIAAASAWVTVFTRLKILLRSKDQSADSYVCERKTHFVLCKALYICFSTVQETLLSQRKAIVFLHLLLR